MKTTVSVKFDRRRKYYLVLDCESATLPCAHDLPAEAKKNVAIAKPLIYDLGWKIMADCFTKTETGIKSDIIAEYWPVKD